MNATQSGGVKRGNSRIHDTRISYSEQYSEEELVQARSRK
jgi:hypothetical protein